MNDLRGKKLLILGGSVDEISLVRRAQELGVYVIVTDYNLDRTLSPAKNLADEAWDVSWAELDTLEEMCRAAGVNGILAGYSELRVERVIALCQRLGLPCYVTPEQLEVTRDKVKFKNACRKNGVPVVHEYASPGEVDHFPVIVKPVDRAGSIGISVASNRAELDRAYAYAMEKSICKQVIIEDYISDGTKFDVYYQVADGEIRLVCSDDVINAKDNGLERVVQSAWLLPSVHHKSFTEKVDASMRGMIRDMGIQNGYLFFSGFANEREEFVFFECGFRLCGGHYYNYFYELGHWNTLDLFLSHALTGSAAGLNTAPRPRPELKCATINLYAKAGTIRAIDGLEAERLPGCAMALTKAHVGQVCNEDAAILSKIGLVHFCSADAADFAADVRRLYELVSVTDEQGRDMIYDRVDPEQVSHWWDGAD